jgi:hypothetical protein
VDEVFTEENLRIAYGGVVPFRAAAAAAVTEARVPTSSAQGPELSPHDPGS